MCLPSDALLQHLPSYLGFSYRGCRVSLHGCSSKVQPLPLTLDEGYLLTAALPDLQRGIAPLGPPAPNGSPGSFQGTRYPIPAALACCVEGEAGETHKGSAIRSEPATGAAPHACPLSSKGQSKNDGVSLSWQSISPSWKSSTVGTTRQLQRPEGSCG